MREGDFFSPALIENHKAMRMKTKNNPGSSGSSAKGMALVLLTLALLVSVVSVLADPTAVSSITNLRNATIAATAGLKVNESQGGGYIYVVSLNATSQNPRWKAYVGNVTGTYVLQDASGNRIYDWSMTDIEGEVYATRKTTSVSWSNIACATNEQLELENVALSHNSSSDNITSTFKSTNHTLFYVGSKMFNTNACNYSLYTYINSTAQTTYFDEIALHDGANMVYAAMIEDPEGGFDLAKYHFQMLVPEVGSQGWSSSTPYYFYVELSAS